MAEYIEREAAVMRLMQDGCSAKNVQTIMTLPAADVAPVRHGRWQYNTDFYVWCCSECGKNPTKGTGVVTTAEKLPAYCPHCGARMDGVEDE